VRIASGTIRPVEKPAGTPSKDGGFVGHARAQQRGSSRLPFAAEVRATELDSGREIWGETANLSKGGCYVRTREPFCQGTLLVIEIRNHGVRLLTDARVAYTLESTGMGLSFLNVPADELPILEQWLSPAGGERPIKASRGATE
jgi:PilZ domain